MTFHTHSKLVGMAGLLIGVCIGAAACQYTGPSTPVAYVVGGAVIEPDGKVVGRVSLIQKEEDCKGLQAKITESAKQYRNGDADPKDKVIVLTCTPVGSLTIQ